jgi:branched-chain amino acid transport system ATP-binding protein
LGGGPATMLEVDRLSVHYGAVRALRGISLRVAEGEIVAVIGPNGAGKSTLLWTIAGVLSPVAGEVRFLGHALGGRPPEAIARDGVALVPEGRHIFRTLTVRENLILGVRRKRGASREDAFQDVFERFPVLERRLSSPAGQLSGGEAQQLAIARALLMRPRLLLLDEPSFGLAPLVVEEVFSTLERLRSEGMTILLIEQNAAQAVKLADRTYVLRTGEVEREGTGQQLLNETDFVSAYFGEEGSKGASASL